MKVQSVTPTYLIQLPEDRAVIPVPEPTIEIHETELGLVIDLFA